MTPNDHNPHNKSDNPALIGLKPPNFIGESYYEISAATSYINHFSEGGIVCYYID